MQLNIYANFPKSCIAALPDLDHGEVGVTHPVKKGAITVHDSSLKVSAKISLASTMKSARKTKVQVRDAKSYDSSKDTNPMEQMTHETML